MKASTTKRVIHFDSETKIKETSPAEEVSGKLASQDEPKLMHSVLQNDKKTIEDGKTIKDALNEGMSSFTPDLMFEQLVKNYSMASKLYGPKLIRRLASYDPNYIERNIRFPEFQRELRRVIEKNVESLKDDGLIDRFGMITDAGISLASLILYTEELDKLIPEGLAGDRLHRQISHYGDKDESRPYRRGDRYRDISIRRSARRSIRRGHRDLLVEDLMMHERKSRGSIQVIYAMDASGSMKGRKIDVCKKAGIALAYKAIDSKDRVGLIIFGSGVKESVPPTTDFPRLLRKIAEVRPSRETNIRATINEAISLFVDDDSTKHLMLLTDAMPTVGKDPEKETLESVSRARSSGITISVIGIKLEKKGRELAQKIAALGSGRFVVVRDVEEIDRIVLEDYRSLL